MVNLYFVDGFNNVNALRLTSLYAKRYPQNRLSFSKTFTKFHARLQEMVVYISLSKPTGLRTIRTSELISRLNILNENLVYLIILKAFKHIATS